MNDNVSAVYASQQLFKPLLWKDETLFITYGNAADESERGMHLFAFLPCATSRSHRMHLEDGPYLTTCIFNRSIINRCFAVWDAWFMRAICELGWLHWKQKSRVSISEGTGLDCTIAQQRANTVRSEALQLMDHYQKQIRLYAAHNHQCRQLQPPVHSQTRARIFMPESIESPHACTVCVESSAKTTPVGIQDQNRIIV